MKTDTTRINPQTGVITRIYLEDGKVHVVKTQDVEPILEMNKAMANHNDGYTASRSMARVASIPATVQLKWREDHGVDLYNPDHQDAVKRLLNSNEWRYLRTSELVL